MCGIFGYIGLREDAAEIVFEGLKQLEYRGYDSWGVAVVPKDGLTKISIRKKAPRVFLEEASVTATEMGLILASSLNEAVVLEDAAAEPHVQDLAKMLIKMGAKIWAKKLGISLKNTLAVGDNLNDLELMRLVGLSVAMGQSPEEVKSVANMTIGDTDENGLAEFLEKLLT